MNETINNSLQKRESGIELLKVLGIIMVILSHAVRALTLEESAVPYTDYIVGINSASLDIRCLIIQVLAYAGQFGNWLFFISSAWFFVDSKQNKKRKILFLVIDVWVVSVIMLVITLFFRQEIISWKMVIKSIFPLTFENNWYVTCYILFYALYPFLNIIIGKLSQNSLFLLSAVMLLLYTGIAFIMKAFFSNVLILWVTIYFAVAYMKRYLPNISNNIKANVFAFCLAVLCHIILSVAVNYLGLHFEILADNMNYWRNCRNPFLITMAVTLFNIFRNLHFSSKIINYISSLSLLIYLIHDNLFVSTYLRAYIWHYIYNRYGYTHIYFWIFAFAICTFLCSIVLASIYKKTIEKLVISISNKATLFISDKYHKIEPLIMKIH